MNSRLTVLALACVLVAAIAVPAIAKPAKVTPKVAQLSTRALAKARLALLTARSAKGQSRVAARTAQAAVNTANDAKSSAASTQAALEGTKIQSGYAGGGVETESKSYVQLAGGPSVTVEVPSSGLIEVWAQVKFRGEGAVGLFEDGQRMSGQSEYCAPEEEGSALLASYVGEAITLSTPSTLSFPAFCGNEGPPAGVLFQTTPGRHTYELRYQFGECGCGGGSGEPAVFSNRLLRVAPRL